MRIKISFLDYIYRKISSLLWRSIDYVSCMIDTFATIYERGQISSEYKKEYAIGGISRHDKVLHIGCGAYPLSEITLAKTIGADVVGIDHNQRTVKFATGIVKKSKLEKKITIECGDGINYPVDGFDTIIVSSCASPKIDILDYLCNNAQPKSKIIIRELDGSTKLVENYLRLQKDIVLTKKIEHHPFPFITPFGWQSFHLTKK